MVARRPTVEEFFRIAEEYNLDPSPADIESYIELSQPILDSYARLDQLTAPSLPVKYPRSPGVRSQPEDNPIGGLVLALRNNRSSRRSSLRQDDGHQGQRLRGGRSHDERHQCS